MNTIQKICAKKVLLNVKNMQQEVYEYDTCYNGDYTKKKARPLSHIFCWTSGFYDGMAGICYSTTENPVFLEWMEKRAEDYRQKVTKYAFETMHDLGFLYSPSMVMLYKITGREEYKTIGIQAADALIKRYIPNGHYIRAWGRMDNRIPDYVDGELAKNHFFTQSNGLAIIDTMMNLPLLFWATEVSSHPVYQSVAVECIETAIKYFVREDYSVYHAYRFDPVSGKPLRGESFCGYGKESYWARGSAWMIYGLAIAYRYTGNKKYLYLSKELCKRFIENCQEDGVPVWDFRLPEGFPALISGKGKAFWDEQKPENIQYNRDTSAAAIVLCAVKEIEKYEKDTFLQDYEQRTYQSLIEKYTDRNEEIEGILTHSDGKMSYTSFGDYFFMEYLFAHREGMPTCW